MTRPQAVRLPSNIRRIAAFDRRLGTTITVTSPDQYNEVAAQLGQMGFVRVSASDTLDVFMGKKKLGPAEIFAVLVGLFLFLLPGVLYLLMWTRQPAPAVAVRKTYAKPTNARAVGHPSVSLN